MLGALVIPRDGSQDSQAPVGVSFWYEVVENRECAGMTRSSLEDSKCSSHCFAGDGVV